MTFDEAKQQHYNQWILGRNSEKEYVFPYNINLARDSFLYTEVDIDSVKNQEVDNNLINKYKKEIENGNDLGPSWGTYGKTLKDGKVIKHWHGKIYLVDGNHRAVAKKELGYKQLELMIPESHYKLFCEDNL